MPSRLPLPPARLLALLPHPPYCRAVSTMTQKRKRTGAHPPPPIPDMPDTVPRRSSRRLKESTDERTPKIDITKMASNPMKLTNTKKVKAVWDTGEGVEEAMRELSEMEHKLQDAVRTQRLAVESSDLHVKKEIAQEPSIRPKVNAPNNNNNTVAARGKLNGKPKAVETAPQDGHDAELAADDMAEAKEENGVDRGANRPPPVNSDTLPLPWKGRLGYVSTRWANYYTLLTHKGLFKYISTQCDTCCVFFPNLPYIINYRAPTSFSESRRTGTCN